VGEIVGLATGKGEMEIVLLVADPAAAEVAIRSILRELNIEDRATIDLPARR
jgi:hypothetical protein